MKMADSPMVGKDSPKLGPTPLSVLKPIGANCNKPGSPNKKFQYHHDKQF